MADVVVTVIVAVVDQQCCLQVTEVTVAVG